MPTDPIPRATGASGTRLHGKWGFAGADLEPLADAAPGSVIVEEGEGWSVDLTDLGAAPAGTAALVFTADDGERFVRHLPRDLPAGAQVSYWQYRGDSRLLLNGELA